MQPTQPEPTTNTVNDPLTSSGPKRVVENNDFAKFAARIVRAYGRRIADGDVDALPGLLDLADDINTALGQAVIGLRDFGYSWADIGRRLGISRQAAQQRWGGERP